MKNGYEKENAASLTYPSKTDRSSKLGKLSPADVQKTIGELTNQGRDLLEIAVQIATGAIPCAPGVRLDAVKFVAELYYGRRPDVHVRVNAGEKQSFSELSVTELQAIADAARAVNARTIETKNVNSSLPEEASV